MRHKCLVLTVKKWLKSVYIYGSYRKIKTGVSLFLDYSVCKLHVPLHAGKKNLHKRARETCARFWYQVSEHVKPYKSSEVVCHVKHDDFHNVKLRLSNKFKLLTRK